MLAESEVTQFDRYMWLENSWRIKLQQEGTLNRSKQIHLRIVSPGAALTLAILLWIASAEPLFAATASITWFDHAPLNTDTDIVGLPWYGLGKAYRFLAVLLNWAVLAAICYALGRYEMEWSNFGYVYAGIVVASVLLSTFLNPLLHIFTLVPIVAVATFLLARYCLLSPARALTATLIYQLYQIGYLLAYKAIAAKYP